MFSADRRIFLHQTAKAGVAWGVSSLFGSAFRSAQTSPPNTDDIVRVYLDSRRVVAPLDRNLFGSFLEHLGRAIYEGVYDPGSKLSEANGFRKDVISEIRQMGVPIVRYPGGNFVSGYNWLDGVGPKESRPRVLDKAWNAINTNQFGTNEFMAWCKAVGTEPLMGLNLGTGTPEEAAALVEYCNLDQGTKWSDLRRKHGVAEPYKVKRWCLGNEMDGPWQIGHMTATEYGMKAQDAARQMRYVDPALQLIACGSSGPFMPTYLEWDREVLEQCYDYVDGLSLHRYFTNAPADTGGDSSKFLAMNLSMEQQIAETLAVCDLVRGHKRSPKQLWLSFDEWNVWYRARNGDHANGHHQEAPHLLEEVYNLEDALLVGGLLNSLLRNANRVKLACLAQLINVIAPISTNATGLLQQTIYYPYNWALQYARGSVLMALVESPTYEVVRMGQVPYVDVAATTNPQDGKVGIFVLNRDLSKPHVVEINWQDKAPGQVLVSAVLTGTDLKAFNTFESPRKVVPQDFGKPSTVAGRTRFEVPARSYTVIQWSA
ncbi:MAG: alpha-N-arabinofuranosidase [Acidobacteria bacterium]|nr:MAG: alpha-N-arabinofuranosidase [Acidobacteriota bacterium]PYU64320.1 MAG: alpha-N-arabinofuranosidase [Acidobacteriota bacterium]PYU75396.1 MAG: alpha-N-arabinofuranosidase [Acidobacteriota bacterium]